MATWAGIALQHPGWAGLLHPQLGRRSLSAPRQASSPGWAGVFLSLAGPSRHLAPALLLPPRQAASPVELPPGWAIGWLTRLGLFPRLGHWLGNPAGPLPPAGPLAG
jgi:hypothetical protein